MIKLNGQTVVVKKYPDGAQKLNLIYGVTASYPSRYEIDWFYEAEEELVTLMFLSRHLKEKSPQTAQYLYMPYIPNARMDRVYADNEVFTLKYFADIINSLEFEKVTVLDPHSSVSTALINNISIISVESYIQNVIRKIRRLDKSLIMYYPDEGAMKRYFKTISLPYVFGIKNRDWETGEILGIDVAGMTDKIKDSEILIVDDICSKGGTFYYGAQKLKELGAEDIYLYVTHCENTIFEGELLKGNLIKKIFTTKSIYTKEHEKIEVVNYA